MHLSGVHLIACRESVFWDIWSHCSKTMYPWTETNEKSADNRKKAYDVIVIGAGISGLTAAYHLLSTCPELEVLVLEAKDRIGGRTLTKELKGVNGTDYWDLGAQWVSNSQTHIMDLLLELGLNTYPQFLDGKKLLQLGNFEIKEYSGPIPNMPFISLLELKWFMYKLEEITKEIDINDPFSHPRAAELDSTTVETYTRSRLFTKPPKDALDIAIRTASGLDPSRISVLSLLTLAAAAGGLMRMFEAEHGGAQEQKIEGGALQISQRLVEMIGKDNVCISSPVVQVFQNNEDDGNNHSVGVVTAAGITFVSRYIVMAVPLHQTANIDFKPTLSEKRRLLMANMPIGHLSKYIVTYSSQFWREKGYSGEIVSNGGPKIVEDCDCGPVSVVFDATTKNGSPALVGFFGGKYATQWCAKPAEMRKLIVLKTLAAFFGDEALSPLDYSEKIWSEEPYNGGCPVNIGAPGIMEYVTNHFRTPTGRIHWAGTETATVWCGYMSGAVQAGRRAAKEILYHLRPNLLSVKDLRDTVYVVKQAQHISVSNKKNYHYLLIVASVTLNILILFYMFQVVG